MKKNIFILLMLGIFVFGLSGLSFAMTCGSDLGHGEQMRLAKARPGADNQEAVPETKPSSEAAVNAGNKICPVSGEKISDVSESGMEPDRYEHKGKIYNFCCRGCIEKFQKDPEKYIEKVEQELQAESKEQAEHKGHEMGMMPEHETMHQGHQH